MDLFVLTIVSYVNYVLINNPLRTSRQDHHKGKGEGQREGEGREKRNVGFLEDHAAYF